jgi:hypothetical protein
VTAYQAFRWFLAVISLATAISAHLILTTMAGHRNGRSRSAFCRWFVAMRAYGALLAVNMVINAITGHANDWAFYLFAVACVYLLYSLLRFLLLIRGRRLPWVP